MITVNATNILTLLVIKIRMFEAMKGEKIRYKSKRDPERFLEYRLTIWEQLKDEKFHAKRMYEKTKEVITGLKA